MDHGNTVRSQCSEIVGQGLQQVSTGVNAGATQASTNNQLAGMFGSLGARGIDAVTQSQIHGADQTLPIFQNAVSVPLGLQKEGIGTMLTQDNKGLDALTGQLNLGTNAINSLGQNAIDAKYGMYLRSIKQRYDGNLQKATLLAKVLSSLGGMTAQSQQEAASGDTSALAAQLLKMGLTSSFYFLRHRYIDTAPIPSAQPLVPRHRYHDGQATYRSQSTPQHRYPPLS